MYFFNIQRQFEEKSMIGSKVFLLDFKIYHFHALTQYVSGIQWPLPLQDNDIKRLRGIYLIYLPTLLILLPVFGCY